MRFRDREEAGHELAKMLEAYRFEHPIVLAVPRGGAPVAFEVARALGARLDVLLVRRIRTPGYAASREGEQRQADLDEFIALHQSLALTRRLREYHRMHPPAALAGQTVILVDDGVATGATALAAARVARSRGARKVVLAVPVIGRQGEVMLSQEVDAIVAPERPMDVSAIRHHYERFEEVSDDRVIVYLRRAPAARTVASEGEDAWDGEWMGDDVSKPPHRLGRAPGSSDATRTGESHAATDDREGSVGAQARCPRGT